MPQFAPGESKTAIAPIIVKPSGLSCEVEIFLGPDELTKVAASGRIPFTSTGASQNVRLPIAMPSEGTYHVYIDVYAGGILIAAYRAIEDVVIAPVTLLANPSFEVSLSPWVAYTNYPGRSHWAHSSLHPRTGYGAAEFAASVSGRPIVATLSQVVPWRDEYRGQSFRLAIWRSIVPSSSYIEGHFAVIINDGIGVTENEVYATSSGYQEQAVTRVLSPNANKLEAIFRIIPHPDWRGGGFYLDDATLEGIG